jgi:hypothetical protein
VNLDLVRKIFGPFNKKTFKIDLDLMETLILWKKFLVPSIALYRGSIANEINKKNLQHFSLPVFKLIFFTQKLTASNLL